MDNSGRRGRIIRGQGQPSCSVGSGTPNTSGQCAPGPTQPLTDDRECSQCSRTSRWGRITCFFCVRECFCSFVSWARGRVNSRCSINSGGRRREGRIIRGQGQPSCSVGSGTPNTSGQCAPGPTQSLNVRECSSFSPNDGHVKPHGHAICHSVFWSSSSLHCGPHPCGLLDHHTYSVCYYCTNSISLSCTFSASHHLYVKI